MSLASRPGLAKTRGDRHVHVRLVTLVRGSDGRLRAMFDAADVVSEGAMRASGDLPVWYGTTSLILPWPASYTEARDRAFLAAVAARDPHVRLRAVRIAQREASFRAPGRLGRAECEVTVALADNGLRIDVDVQAPLTLSPHQKQLGATDPVPRL
jgi:hypothetical protein